MPFGPSDLIWIGLVPGVAAVLAMFVCIRWRVRPTAAWAMSIGVGLVVGMFGLNLRGGWQLAAEKLLQPRVALDWLPWLVLVAAGISALAAYVPRTWQRWLVALACGCAAAVPLRLLAGSVYVTMRWSTWEKLAALALWAMLIAILWFTLAAGRRSGQPLLRGALLLLVAFGMSLTVTLSGAITLGELGGLAAATLFAATAAVLALGELHDGPSGAAGPLAVMLGGLILLSHFYSELTATNAALLAISLAAAGGWLPRFKLPLPWHEGWGNGAVRATLALVSLAIAIASAYSVAMSNPYG